MGRISGRNATWKRLLAASWISNTGDGIRLAALPLLALNIGGSALDVSAIVAASYAPMLVVGIPAGVLADRRARKPLVVFADAFRALVTAGLLVTIAVDRVSILLLILVAVALGIGEAIADSALPGMVHELVDDETLEHANGQLGTASMVANELVGPPLGSALFSAGRSIPFVVDMVSFGASAVLAAGVDVAEGHLARQEPNSNMQQVRDGWDLVRSNAVLRTTGVIVVTVSFFHLAAIAPFAVYLTSDDGLGLSPTDYGFALAAGGAAASIGSFYAARIIKRFGGASALLGALIASAVGFAAMASNLVAPVVGGYVVSFMGLAVGRVAIVAARQRATPAEYQGRVQSVMRVGIWGANALGAIAGGIMSEAVGLHAPSAVAAVAYTGAGLFGARAIRRTLDHRVPLLR